MKNDRVFMSGLRFGGVMDEWLRVTGAHVKPTTFAAYDTIIKRHLKPFFGDLPPKKVTDAAIEEFRRAKSDSGLAPATVRGIMNVLRAAVRYGRRYGCPAGEEVFRGPSGVTASEISVLSDDEQSRIVSALGENPDGKGLGVLICIYTGLRVGEICGLRWGDVAQDCRSLTVRRTVSRMRCESGTELYVGEPKSVSSRRRIPLPATLSSVMEWCRGPDEYYVVTDSPDRIPEPRNMQRYFSELQTSAGVKRVKFHALRHTFATRCVELGFDVKSLSMILGHANVSVTLNTYVHPSFERLKSMMELLDG